MKLAPATAGREGRTMGAAYIPVVWSRGVADSMATKDLLCLLYCCVAEMSNID